MNTPDIQLPSTVDASPTAMVTAIPRMMAVAENSDDPRELRECGALAKGMKATAKALGIAELHAKFPSWIEETALRRLSLMKTPPKEHRPDGTFVSNPNEGPLTGAERVRLHEANSRERHRDLPAEEFERTKAESLAMNTPAKPHVFHNSGENEWYTPAHIVEAARACMGGIDLDPATSAKAQETVKAEAFYTIGDDALALSW